MGKKKLWILFILYFIFTNCSLDNTNKSKNEIGINFQNDVEILSSDEFEGRAPATRGGEKAKTFIENRFKEIGLQPSNGNSYRQAVPLLETESYNFSPLNIQGKNYSIALTSPNEIVIGSYRMEEEIELKNSALVFAG